MAEVIAFEQQTFFDIAIQHSGSVQNAFQLAVLNGQAITDRIKNVTTPLGFNGSGLPSVYNYIEDKQLIPSSEIRAAQDGIGYMAIEEDFIIE